MTAARLSPAASLLRNSRLFALPAAVPLPPVEPSSELVSGSNTATTLYPVRAAIETPSPSLLRGDWGLKRSLPTKTTTKSGTPVIRIQGGIDTPEHVADFESAADHAVTLRKFQELNMRFTLPDSRGAFSPEYDYKSVFSSDADNTTTLPLPSLPNKSAADGWLRTNNAERVEALPSHLRSSFEEAKKQLRPSNSDAPASQASAQSPSASTAGTTPLKRWRFEGPYLAGLNGMQFDRFIKTITPSKREEFRQFVKADLAQRRRQEMRAAALEQGTVFEEARLSEVTEEEVTEYLKRLRTEPGHFGTLIANFFDLADGPAPPTGRLDTWQYSRDNSSAERYREYGPPTTHPSGGLSYLKHLRQRTNDPVTGPRDETQPMVGRHLRSHQERNRYTPEIGVAGFTVSKLSRAGATERLWKWEPKPGGPKYVVSPSRATMGSEGKVLLQVKHLVDWEAVDDKPIAKQDLAAIRSKKPEGAKQRSARLPEYRVRSVPVGQAADLKSAEPALADLQKMSKSSPFDDMGI